MDCRLSAEIADEINLFHRSLTAKLRPGQNLSAFPIADLEKLHLEAIAA
jgi:hypothetical protein